MERAQGLSPCSWQMQDEAWSQMRILSPALPYSTCWRKLHGKNPKQWRVVFPPSKNNKLHPYLSFSELLHNPFTRTEETALQGGYKTSKWKHFQMSSPHLCPFPACQMHRQVGQVLPPPIFIAFTPNVQISSMQEHPIFTIVKKGEWDLSEHQNKSRIYSIYSQGT